MEHALHGMAATSLNDPTKRLFWPIRLVWPPLLPICVLAIAFIAERAGHKWQMHGDAILIALLFLGTMFFAVVMSVVLLFTAIPILRRVPEERTIVNVLSTAFAASFVVLSVALIAYAVIVLE
jgi:hypothetical protein